MQQQSDIPSYFANCNIIICSTRQINELQTSKPDGWSFFDDRSINEEESRGILIGAMGKDKTNISRDKINLTKHASFPIRLSAIKNFEIISNRFNFSGYVSGMISRVGITGRLITSVRKKCKLIFFFRNIDPIHPLPRLFFWNFWDLYFFSRIESNARNNLVPIHNASIDLFFLNTRFFLVKRKISPTVFLFSKKKKKKNHIESFWQNSYLSAIQFPLFTTHKIVNNN